MADQQISDAGIAVMCDTARASGLDLDNKQLVLDRLIAGGLVEVAQPARPVENIRFALTADGQRLLDARGVGANQS